VLLDEPFSGLDAPQRAALRKELRRLQLGAGLSSVLVSHDSEEAALLADEILVIARGRALQAGPTAAVLRYPASPEVAAILGFRNIFAGVADSPVSLKAGRLSILTEPHGLSPGVPVTWCIHPEHVGVIRRTVPGTQRAELLDIAQLGTFSLATLCLDGLLEIEARLGPGDDPPDPGEPCWVTFPPEEVLIWPRPAQLTEAAW